ncbi:MAG: heat shock protein HslJ [Verrucomicrobiales bacterium]|jgi:heat shock protein HslJ
MNLNASIVPILQYPGSEGEKNRVSRSIPNGLILSGSGCNRIFGHYAVEEKA